MPEKRTTVNYVWVEYLCDSCFTPVRAITIVVATGNKWLHTCPYCTRQYLLERAHPYMTEPPHADT